jgi:hypothetical protein
MAISFIGRGNQSKTCLKSLTNLILDAPMTHAYEEDNLFIFFIFIIERKSCDYDIFVR